MSKYLLQVAWYLALGTFFLGGQTALMAQNRYATSDNQSGYVHWIELYDAANNRINPQAEFPMPYSPERTCGRCHEFDTISHGWHFNAVDPQANHGRPGQPWIWSDPGTGTHLPLSYRDWDGTHNPDALGLTRWQVAAKLGGFLPGGGPGSSESLANEDAQDRIAKQADPEIATDRSSVTGPLPIDCLLCHRNEGSGYSPFEWTAQIEDENFAYAPTVALGLAQVVGTVARLKDFDPTAADAASKLPKLTYNQTKFRSDGKVFIDLVRKPQSNSCYYCHTNITADSVKSTRWAHDEDVHLRAGFACADCHRNGLDHHTVRGFDHERHPAGSIGASLSCQGCHLGSSDTDGDSLAQAGRLGAPLPEHRGLPPIHFQKLTCTACHSGPPIQQEVPRLINSIAHLLGGHVKRTGDEMPGIVGPVNLPVNYAIEHSNEQHELTYTPHRLFWPSFWGTIDDKGKATPLNPELAYELVRRPLRAKRTGDFTEELADVSLDLSQRRELLGEERARVKEEDRTEDEKSKVAAAERVARQQQVDERLMAALVAIEEKFPDKQAVYITGGTGWIRYGDKLKMLQGDELTSGAAPYAWPMAHNVRPARQALGAKGCTECHSDGSSFFSAEVQPVGLLPEQAIAPIKVSVLQHADMDRLRNWNKLFAGRSSFKIASLIAFAATCLIVLSALVWNIGTFWQRRA